MEHALVIGGTKGIGRRIAEVLEKEGYSVSVFSRNKHDSVTDCLKNIHFSQVDITCEKTLKKGIDDTIKQNGPLNHIIFSQRYRGNKDQWAGEIDTSLTATKNTIDYVSQFFSESGNTSITIISSIASSFIVDEQPAGYHVAKAGLNQLARYYAVKLGPRGIRVNTVSPGTTVKQESQEYYNQNKELSSLIEKITPLRRMGTADDVANAVSFLCSCNSSFITGNDICIDGGVSLQGHESNFRQLITKNNQ